MQNRDVIKGVLVAEPEPLELTDEMIERNDTIHNAVYDCILALAEKNGDELPWNMSIIGEATDAIQAVLENHGFQMRYPAIVTEPDGRQHYDE